LGIGPFSAVGCASASPQVFTTRAFARANGVNNPAIQSAPPLRQSAPGRRRGQSEELVLGASQEKTRWQGTAGTSEWPRLLGAGREISPPSPACGLPAPLCAAL